MKQAEVDAFLAIVESGSLTRAAQKLYLTQSTLSSRLDCLEKELGAPLLIRKKGIRRVELTEAGRQINLDWQRRCRVMEEAMLSGFNPEERRQFADYLSRAYRNLRAEREEGTE